MLTVVRSPAPGLRWASEPLPRQVTGLLRLLEEQQRQFLWVVPTSRRRRALLRQAVGGAGRAAALLPRIHTLESFAAQALEYSPRAWPRIAGPERLLRLARIWFDLTGRPPGQSLVRQLDRFVRDWQACRLQPARDTGDLFEQVVHRFQTDLAADGRLDRVAAFALLIDELADTDSWPRRYFFKDIGTVLFDGFHRLEPIELDLVGELSRQHDVTLWVVAAPGQVSWTTAAAAVQYLDRSGYEFEVVDHESRSGPLAELGRRLFPSASEPQCQVASAGKLFKLEARGPLDEVEAVARSIKRDYLAARAGGAPMRLSDVAVIIPGPGYDALIREAFPRAGLEFNLAGRALDVVGSRPARVLTAALDLIQGQWRHDLLLDFLSLPLVKLRLEHSHRLHDLFAHGPRARKRLDHASWQRAWTTHLARLRSQIARWATGEIDLPERERKSPQEFLDRQNELVTSLQQLLESIERVLQPVSAIERLLASPPAKNAMPAFVKQVAELLRGLKIENWLQPPVLPSAIETGQAAIAHRPVPWVEYEKDQQAYFKLLRVLQTLATVPDGRLPLLAPGRPDLRAALLLALDSESYQIKTEDDAGVQIFEMREVRGMSFRHVYVLGLVDGLLPTLPEEGLLASRRRQSTELSHQLDIKEDEAKFLFAQVFESARDKLVLSRWTEEGDRPAPPSPFFARVQSLTAMAALEQVKLAPSSPEAAWRLGKRLTRPADAKRHVRELWPAVSGDDLPALQQMSAAVASWKNRPAATRPIHIELPELLVNVFPADRPFSPSELEQYAACPFRYFGNRVLGLAEREADDSHMAHGSLIHRVLNKFYEERRRATGDSKPLPPVGPADRPRLVQLYHEEWQQEPEGMLSPELRAIFENEHGLVDFFLELMVRIEADGGNLWTELPLQVRLGTDALDRPVFLNGKIDRVDGSNNGKREARILDYKTGAIADRKELSAKLSDGRRLQLPLYAAALELHKPELTVTNGMYVHLPARKNSRESTADSAIIQVGALKANGTDGAFDTHAAVELALDFAGKIRDGEFPLTSFPPGSDLCECHSRCPLRHACRHPDSYEVSGWWK